MLKVYDPNQTRPYSLQDDTDPKTVFIIGGLVPRLHSHLSNNINDTQKGRTLAGDIIRDTVRFGVKGWENFVDSKGDPVLFDEKLHTASKGTSIGSFKGLSDLALDLIPWKVQQELFNVITESNTISEQDAKN